MEYEISTEEDIEKVISKLTDEMITYAKELNFEKAAEIRDKIKELEKMLENVNSKSFEIRIKSNKAPM